jgi:hypothetical protein
MCIHQTPDTPEKTAWFEIIGDQVIGIQSLFHAVVLQNQSGIQIPGEMIIDF